MGALSFGHPKASNLCTLIAGGDVALSVLMTTSTTLGCIAPGVKRGTGRPNGRARWKPFGGNLGSPNCLGADFPSNHNLEGVSEAVQNGDRGSAWILC